MAYPPEPWHLHGQMWLSLFRAQRPGAVRGVHGVALVSYETPSPLTYAELLVAHPLPRRDGGGPGSVRISDIWVDSVDSRDGGRALWAIPKDLATFTRTSTTRRTAWVAGLDGRPIVEAGFTDVGGPWPRLPFLARTVQQRASGETVPARMRGTARIAPCRATWRFDADGPLAWLAGERPVGSFVLRDFRLAFGQSSSAAADA